MVVSWRRQTQEGFTFVELMVVLLILGLLMGVGVPAYMAWMERTRVQTTKTNLRLLKQNMELFHGDHGSYPAKLEDLATRPKGDLGKDWHKLLDKVPLDGWKHEFEYRKTPGKKHPFELNSYGSGGPDDPDTEKISVWDL